MPWAGLQLSNSSNTPLHPLCQSIAKSSRHQAEVGCRRRQLTHSCRDSGGAKRILTRGDRFVGPDAYLGRSGRRRVGASGVFTDHSWRPSETLRGASCIAMCWPIFRKTSNTCRSPFFSLTDLGHAEEGGGYHTEKTVRAGRDTFAAVDLDPVIRCGFDPIFELP